MPANAGRHEAVGRRFAHAGDRAHQQFAVEAQVQRFAQRFGIERRALDVQAQKEHAEIGADAQLLAEARAQPVQPARRHRLGDLQIAGGVALEFAGGILGDVEAHALDGRGRVEMRIAR